LSHGQPKCSQTGQCNLDLGGGRNDVFAVKTSTLGKILSPLWICLALVCSAAKAPPTVIPLGDNTFSITSQATSAFTRDTDKLKVQIQDEAAKYCADQGKQMRVVSLTSEKPMISFGYVSAKIIFRAVNPGDPDPVSQPAATLTGGNPTPTGDLYSDLLKLDDLHKKGILTDKEFASEKKKVLKRSQ
jgi:hypothetical protein